MNRKFTFVLFALMTTLLLSACGGVEVDPSGTQPEVEDTSLALLEVPPKKVGEEAEESVIWTLPEPPEAQLLPTELALVIEYIQSPENCAKENDPNETCSTKKGQATNGDFSLQGGQSLVMTGDLIGIFDSENNILVDRPSLNTNHDLWVVVNNSDVELDLHMTALHGSFRGYFATTGGWNVQKITHLRDLHLYLFLLPEQTYDRFTPTPVPNCESKYGCDKVNVRVLVFDEEEWQVVGYGLYLEGQPWWQSFLQFLGQ